MLRPSFVTPKPVRQLRDLTRLWKVLTEERARYRTRIQDVLEDACIKVTDKDEGLSDLFGVSGRTMLDALVAGERDPAALTGQFEDHHGRMIGRMLCLHDTLTAQIDELTAEIEAAIAELAPTPPPDPNHLGRKPLLDRLDEIPGVGRDAAQVILSEIGFDMGVFPTAGHLASWAKLTPRTIQSGAKSTHGRTGKGNRWLKSTLGNAAVSTSRTKTFLGTRYRRIAKHAPKKKAVVAVSRNILEIAWVLIGDPDARFVDLGEHWHDRHVNTARRTRQAVRDLEHLGYTVTLTPAA
jgi:transposase